MSAQGNPHTISLGVCTNVLVLAHRSSLHAGLKVILSDAWTHATRIQKAFIRHNVIFCLCEQSEVFIVC